MEFDGDCFQQMENILLCDDDDDDGFIVIFTTVAVVMNSNKIRRANFYVRDRKEWEPHVEELITTGEEKFTKIYRIEYRLFKNLRNILYP